MILLAASTDYAPQLGLRYYRNTRAFEAYITDLDLTTERFSAPLEADARAWLEERERFLMDGGRFDK